jgi:hypothetical protein
MVVMRLLDQDFLDQLGLGTAKLFPLLFVNVVRTLAVFNSVGCCAGPLRD